MPSLNAKALEACPFCGGEASLRDGGPGCFFVQCDMCSATSDDGSQDRAIARWNDRVALSALPQAGTVDALAQEIRRVDGNHSLGAGQLAEALMPFLAALSLRQQEEAMPDGWRLVPVEPLPEMLGAWYRYKSGHHFHDEPPPRDTSDYGAYRAMLAAAPSPVPADAGEPSGGRPEFKDLHPFWQGYIEELSSQSAAPWIKALELAQERFAQIDCASIGLTQNTTPQELLDWCKCIASDGFDATSKSLRSALVPATSQAKGSSDEATTLLREARRWFGDGEQDDGIPREFWTEGYRDIVDRVDDFLASSKAKEG